MCSVRLEKLTQRLPNGSKPFSWHQLWVVGQVVPPPRAAPSEAAFSLPQVGGIGFVFLDDR
jgi:hypothetical protein